MILTFEDFMIIFTLFTPVYALGYNNLLRIGNIDIRLSELEAVHTLYHKER